MAARIGISGAISAQRAQQLYGLPEWAKKILTHESRHQLISLQDGSLDTRPRRNENKVVGASLTIRELRIKIYPEEFGPRSETDLARLALVILVPILTDYAATTVDPNLTNYLSIHLGILGLFLTAEDFNKSGILVAAQTANYNVVFQVVTAQEARVQSEEVWNEYNSTFGGGHFAQRKGNILAYALACLLLIAKRPTSQSVAPWFKNMLRAILPLIMKTASEEEITNPTVTTTNAYNTALATYEDIRIAAFKVMRDMTKMTNNRYTQVFIMLYDLLAFAEMNHIIMISKFILHENPELCALGMLVGPEISSYQAVLEKIREIPVEDRPYLKLLYKKIDTKIYNARNFPYLITAAFAVARMSSPSYRYYQPTTNSMLDSWDKSVTDYIKLKRSTGVYGCNVIKAGAQFMMDKTKQKMMKEIDTSIAIVNPFDNIQENRE